jgi:hypothetical protein
MKSCLHVTCASMSAHIYACALKNGAQRIIYHILADEEKHTKSPAFGPCVVPQLLFSSRRGAETATTQRIPSRNRNHAALLSHLPLRRYYLP